MNKINELYFRMAEYNKGYPKYIQHFAKVHDYALQIAIAEGLSAEEIFLIESMAIVHDIGVLPAKKEYGSSNGKYQELLSEKPLRPLLASLAYDEEQIARIVYVVSHHHTYNNIDGLDYQIIVEADFLVNLYEANNFTGEKEEAVKAAYNNIFKTAAGKKLCRLMFSIDEKGEKNEN